MPRIGTIAVAALAISACAPHARTPSPESAAASITSVLQLSAQDWNRGDLAGFLASYQDSDSTTFVTSSGLIHGVAAIRARYLAGYWKQGGLPPQLLRFDELVVRPLGPDHALVTGRYILTERSGGAAAGQGRFSLVFRRTPAGWKIVHDHSSAFS